VGRRVAAKSLSEVEAVPVVTGVGVGVAAVIASFNWLILAVTLPTFLAWGKIPNHPTTETIPRIMIKLVTVGEIVSDCLAMAY
jgi:hypothetical protein